MMGVGSREREREKKKRPHLLERLAYVVPGRGNSTVKTMKDLLYLGIETTDRMVYVLCLRPA